MLRTLGFGLVILTGLLGPALDAHAVGVSYRLHMDVVTDEPGLIGAGESHTMFLFLETSTPDENPASGEFSATGTGFLDTNYPFVEIVPISTIDASVLAGSWDATGAVSGVPFVGDLEWVAQIIGIDLTADVIGPDFDGVDTGTGLQAGQLGVTDTDGLPVFLGSITSVSLVPEPGTAVLVGTGLLGLALRRRRSCATLDRGGPLLVRDPRSKPAAGRRSSGS